MRRRWGVVRRCVPKTRVTADGYQYALPQVWHQQTPSRASGVPEFATNARNQREQLRLGARHHFRLPGAGRHIPMKQGDVYLTAVIDWASRKDRARDGDYSGGEVRRGRA